MKIALGCDHGGYAMKEDIKKQLEGLGHEVKDCGTYSTESCDYPIFGEAGLLYQVHDFLGIEYVLDKTQGWLRLIGNF